MIKRLCITAALAAALSACGADTPAATASSATHLEPNPALLVDINLIANKSKAEVQQAIGEPAGCEKAKRSEICSYATPAVQVEFIADRSERITVLNMDAVRFTPIATVALGLPKAWPSFSNAYGMRWNNQFGFKEINIFPKGDKVDYAYIKVSLD